eukprot:SAG31_NODE_40050_length_283_cov_1.375000_1_plen_60_part_01
MACQHTGEGGGGAVTIHRSVPSESAKLCCCSSQRQGMYPGTVPTYYSAKLVHVGTTGTSY